MGGGQACRWGSRQLYGGQAGVSEAVVAAGLTAAPAATVSLSPSSGASKSWTEGSGRAVSRVRAVATTRAVSKNWPACGTTISGGSADWLGWSPAQRLRGTRGESRRWQALINVENLKKNS